MKETVTSRLNLRHFKKSDLNDLYEYASIPGVGEQAGWIHHHSLKESASVLDYIFIPDAGAFALELKENHKVIGSITIKKDSKTINDFPSKVTVELGYVLSPAYEHHGYMTEAVNALTKEIFTSGMADVITICHYKGNEKSERVMLRCGYKYYRMVRNIYVPSLNRTTDNLCFYLTKESYFKRFNLKSK